MHIYNLHTKLPGSNSPLVTGVKQLNIDSQQLPRTNCVYIYTKTRPNKQAYFSQFNFQEPYINLIVS